LQRKEETMKSYIRGAAIVVAVLVGAATANASTYDVNFQFTSAALATETVTGTIVTDCDSCFLQQADVSSWSLIFSGAVTGSASSGPLNQSPPEIFSNALDATGGKLLYVSSGGNGALFTDFTGGGAQLEFGFNFPDGTIHVQNSSSSIFGAVTQPFQIATEEVVSTVPLPGALPLIATGLGALGLLGWRRKRKALAA
jgi:hypothetical protein